MGADKKHPTIIIAAGGTGGHIFPALAVALQLRKLRTDVSLVWIGTARSREVELCKRNGIPLVLLDVTGIERKLSVKAVSAAMNFVLEFFRVRSMFAKSKPAAVIAFGGYVCAPVLAAARLLTIPYFIHEQNTVAGLVNRIFAAKARRVFAGLPLIGRHKLGLSVLETGTPVRPNIGEYKQEVYPNDFDKTATTILICGGSQGAQTMNACCISPVRNWVKKGFQVVWQTGAAGYQDVIAAVGFQKSVFVFPTVDDLYPFYASASVVVGRAGASTLAEIAGFGLPCVLIPLPWATENHQWINAGVVESQGWGLRIKQDECAAKNIDSAVLTILSNKETAEIMRRKALDHAPLSAAATIVQTILGEINL